MKKHQLLKYAYDNYSKGTKFKSLSGNIFESTGIFDFNFGSIFRVDENGKLKGNVYTEGWAEIVKPKIAVKVENEKLPLLTSEDGVYLYKGDQFYTYFCDEGREWGPHVLQSGSSVLLDPKNRKAFSTKQAALDWIEAQKPHAIVISPDSGYPIIVYRNPVCGDEYIHLDMSKRGDYNGANIHLTIDELRQAVKAYDEMHS